MPSNPKHSVPVASETLDILKEISSLLNTGLDDESLVLCLQLCENGVNPEALAEVIKELRRATTALQDEQRKEM